MTPPGLWVLSPWYGVLELVGEPGEWAPWAIECWNGAYVATYVTDTLEPLTASAATMLRVPVGWRPNQGQVSLWESARFNVPFFGPDGSECLS